MHAPTTARRACAAAAARWLLGARALSAAPLLVALHDWLGIGGAGLDYVVNGAVYDAVVVARRPRLPAASARAPAASAAPGSLIGAAILAWGGGRDLLDRLHRGNAVAALPLARRHRLPRLLPARRSRARRCWSAPGRTSSTGGSGWTALIAALGTAALGAAFVFDFVADQHRRHARSKSRPRSPIRSATSSMLALVVGVIALTRWRPGRTWSLLLAGLAALVVADIAYTLQSTEAALPGGDWIEPIYLIARRLPRRRGLAAGERPTIQPGARFDGWRELIVPAIFAGGDDRPLRDAVLQREPAASRPCSGRRRCSP